MEKTILQLFHMTEISYGICQSLVWKFSKSISQTSDTIFKVNIIENFIDTKTDIENVHFFLKQYLQRL